VIQALSERAVESDIPFGCPISLRALDVSLRHQPKYLLSTDLPNVHHPLSVSRTNDLVETVCEPKASPFAR
jgi:hypothetical protein